MWRDQLDAFWDGQRTFAIGFFKAAETMRAAGLRPDLMVVSARNAEFTEEATLLDVIDARRWRCGHCIINLPQDHKHISLHSPDGAELHFSLTGEDSSIIGGEWRLLLTELLEGPPNPMIAFRLASLSARGGLERLTRDQIVRSGLKLVWAICQRRYVERRDGAAIIAHLWPTRRAFPEHQSRIEIEAIETPLERCSNMRRAPFAVMENWLRENGAPPVALRIEIPRARDQGESILSRTGVVLVMHQRRRFRDWVRQQKAAGSPVVDLLGFEDIRQATGSPLEKPDAVESGGAIVVHNLLSMATSSETTEFDGVAIRRISDSAGADAAMVFDLYFFGATLGDDIGLVSTSASFGDFGVIPSDPGGAPYVRLFRVEGDGLQPRKVDDDDILLDEILRLSAAKERPSRSAPAFSNAEEADGVQERREKFLSALNSALAPTGYDGRLHCAKIWDIFEPALLTSFVAMVEDADPEARAALLKLGGYESYRTDPSLVQSLMRHPDVAATADETGLLESQSGSQSLVHRFASAFRVPGLVASNADIHTQIQNWRILTQPSLAKRLALTRISLAGADDAPQKIDESTRLLTDEAFVERAVAFCDELELDHEAKALRDYLARRRAGEWTSLDEAERLSLMVQEANDYWRRIEERQATSATEAAQPPAPAKPTGFFATVRNFFSRGSGRSRS